MKKTHITTEDVCNSCFCLNQRKMGIFCSLCKCHFHLSCVGLTKRKAENITIWKCKSCSSKEENNICSEDLFCDPARISNPEETLKYISRIRSSVSIPVKLPKASRTFVAEALNLSIKDALKPESGSLEWLKLFLFPSLALGIGKSAGPTSSLATTIKKKVKLFMNGLKLPLDDQGSTKNTTGNSKRPKTEELRLIKKLIRLKLMEGDIRGAVRLLPSDPGTLKHSPETVLLLQEKHPGSPVDARTTKYFCADQLLISNEDTIASLRTFRRSSGGGIDGLRPGHLRDLTAPAMGSVGKELLNTTTKLINRVLSGEVSSFGRELLFSANLIALRKPDGGVRPIAIGNVFRRLSMKLISSILRNFHGFDEDHEF